MQMINANQAEFLRMVNEPAGPGGPQSMEQLAAQLGAAGGGEGGMMGPAVWEINPFPSWAPCPYFSDGCRI